MLSSMTHYEYTRIRGIRLQQLEDGVPPFVPVEKGDSNVDIFNKEVKANKLPFIIHRKTNDNADVQVNAEALEIFADLKM